MINSVANTPLIQVHTMCPLSCWRVEQYVARRDLNAAFERDQENC